MRYFFRRHVPPTERILLIESGSRSLLERLIPLLGSQFGEHVEIDVVTCYAGQPEGLRGVAFNVNDYGGGAGRTRLAADLAERGHAVVGIICSAEPIMTKWKWWLGAKLPAKLFIINENGDYFWLDWSHASTIRQFAFYRAGLTGSSAVPSLVRLILFPLTFSFLALYALIVHSRRWLRTQRA